MTISVAVMLLDHRRYRVRTGDSTTRHKYYVCLAQGVSYSPGAKASCETALRGSRSSSSHTFIPGLQFRLNDVGQRFQRQGSSVIE